eukprot:6180706-Pleurochrysis_carterae.AAC.6
MDCCDARVQGSGARLARLARAFEQCDGVAQQPRRAAELEQRAQHLLSDMASTGRAREEAHQRRRERADERASARASLQWAVDGVAVGEGSQSAGRPKRRNPALAKRLVERGPCRAARARQSGRE